MRRSPLLLTVLAVALLGLFAAVRGGATTAQEGDGPALAGSWRVAITFPNGPTPFALSTYGADGTVVHSGVTVAMAPPGGTPGVDFYSAGHGAWEATGPDTANATWVHLRSSAEGQPLGTRTVRLAVTLGADGQTFSGDIAIVLADPAGTAVLELTGTVEATRIVAEAPGMPEASTPAS